MYLDKRILGIIPARGGSKGVPKKNVRMFAGKPLLGWTIEEASKSKYIDRCIVSTDDEEICNIAKEQGGDVPFLRPADLSRDDTPSIDVVLHVIKEISEYDYVVLLQPTSPLRTIDDIDGAITYCMQNNADSCVSIVESEHSPYWMYMLDENEKMTPLLKSMTNNNYQRQKLPKVYRLNGAIYVNSCMMLKDKRKFVDTNTIAYVMQQDHSYDIDTLMDFAIAEMIMKNRKS